MTNSATVSTWARTSASAACAFGLLTVTLLAGMLAGAQTSRADSGYRYWSYWNNSNGSWSYASEGSGTRIPADGDVEGWRFGIAGDESFVAPSRPPDFASICSQQSRAEGMKRIAVVIDPGSSGEAPAGEEPGPIRTECVVTNAKTTGYQVLAQIAEVRTDAGFVCGLDGYPASECAPLVETPEVTEVDSSTNLAADEVSASAPPTTARVESTSAPDPGTPLLSAAAVSLVALIGFGIWRRRRHTEPV